MRRLLILVVGLAVSAASADTTSVCHDCGGREGMPMQEGPPRGRAGGDLAGDYPDPEVVGLRGREISSTSPDNNSILVYESSRWNPVEPGGDVAGEVADLEVVGLRGRELATTTPRSGYALVYTGFRWEPVGPGGDIAGGIGDAQVTGLQGRPLSTEYPETGDVLTWDGWRWTSAPPARVRGETPLPSPPADDWLEEFGGVRLVGGRASVELSPGFLSRVRLDGSSPFRVFLQQTAGDPIAVTVRKAAAGFAVLGPGSAEAEFDFRVVARRAPGEGR